MSRSDDSTKENLLQAAEILFAKQGFDASSLREITSAAGANLASVSYHFGNKDGLLRALLQDRAQPIIAERFRLLDLVIHAAAPNSPPVRTVLQTFIEPVMRIKRKNPHFPLLMARLEIEGLHHFIHELFRETIERYLAVLQKSLPRIPQEVIVARLIFTVGSFNITIHKSEMLNTILGMPDEPPSLHELTQHLIDFCEAGVCAPLSDGESSL